MPNVALLIAYNVATSGRYEGGSWIRLKGTESPTDPPLRAYHLPGEPLYLAAGLAMRRPVLFTFWHVPVTVLLALATAACALALFGPDAALVTGAIAALDPVTLVHGHVYDDTFLGAALLWAGSAILIRRWVDTASGAGQPPTTAQPWLTFALMLAAGWASITRSELFAVFVVTAACCAGIPALTALRRSGVAIAVAILVAGGSWTARNALVLHHPVVGSTHDGLTLWESTAPQAGRALSRGQVDALSTDPAIVEPLWRETAATDEVGANDVFWTAAVRGIWAEPRRVTGLAFHKVLLSVLGVRPEESWASARNAVSIAVAILLAVAAALGWRRIAATPSPVRHVPAIAAWALALECVVVLAIGPVGIRYWIAGRPLLWILAGCLVLRVGATRASPAVDHPQPTNP